MKKSDASILSAMDGHDVLESEKLAPKLNVQSSREEPSALFFAIFGLIFEALSTSSADSTPSPTLRRNAIIALEALKSLVKPEYSGKALLEPTIFDELIGLCYRMAMTEPASVQIHLVEALDAFATAQKDNMLLSSSM